MNIKRIKRNISRKLKNKNISVIIPIIGVVLLFLFFDISVFLVLLYIVIHYTVVSLKKLNSLNLESDLNCWGLRLLSMCLVFVGSCIVMISVMSITITTVVPLYYNIIWIVGLCIIVISIFSGYRSTRRYGTFVYLR